MILLDKVFMGVLLGGSLLLYIVAEMGRKYKNNEWRALYCLPSIVSLFLLAAEGFEIYMCGAYLGVILLLAGMMKDDLKVRRSVCLAAVFCGLLTIPLCLCNKGYRTDDYVKDFKEGVAFMKDHYVLTEHKGVDFDALYEEYLPMFKEADKNHDKVANAIAWNLFCAEFHDGHTGFQPKEDATYKEALRQAAGNDYGLSLMGLADGTVVAVNVEESEFFKEAGIQNGTPITSWDGREIHRVARESLLYRMTPFADKDNEAFQLALYAAGVGGESVKITYLDASGREKELELSKQGEYFERLEETIKMIDKGVETGHMMWAEVAPDAVALRIKIMMFDSESAKKENYESMQKEIREKAAEYQNGGKKHLILDLRDNGGGSGQMVKALVSLFALPGEYYYCTDGLWDDAIAGYVKDEKGKYVPGKEHYFQGENIWQGPITLLVNQNSASAADHLTKVMQGMDNVTVMGFTEPNGSAQGVNGIHLKSGDLSFSSSLMLDKNGDIYVDSDTKWESGNEIDIRIPFDREAVKVLFEENGDYVLQKCLEYYEK